MDKTCSKRCGWHRICRVSTTLQPRNGYRRAKLFVSPRSRLAPGHEADIVFLRLDSPHFVPLRSPLIQMVFAENGASVHTVMIGGRIVFQAANSGPSMNLCCGGKRKRPRTDWTRPTPARTHRRRRSRDWSEHSAAQGCTGHTLPRKFGLTCDG